MPTNNAWNSQNPAQVARGGTGRATLTDYNVIVGYGTNPVVLIPPDPVTGIPFVSNGVGANPGYGTAVVAGGGTGNNIIDAYCPVVGGTTNTNPLQTVDPSAAVAGEVLTYTGTPGNPGMPVWAIATPSPAPGYVLSAFQVHFGNKGVVTGDGSAYTYSGATVLYDLNGDWVAPSFFHVPANGAYLLSLTARIGGISATANSFIIISRLFGVVWSCGARLIANSSNEAIVSISWFGHYLAGQDEYIQLLVSGTTLNITAIDMVWGANFVVPV